VLGDVCSLCVTVKGVSKTASVEDVELDVVALGLDVSVAILVMVDVVNNVDGDVVVVVSAVGWIVDMTVAVMVA
jgi:hypothetical protein